MKFGVLTTRHHDGFALWDSKVSDFISRCSSSMVGLGRSGTARSRTMRFARSSNHCSPTALCSTTHIS
jgi:hypothetical protein